MRAISVNPQIRQPRIFVICLSAYERGHLHGDWFDATRDVWGMWEDVRAMLAASPVDADDYAIHDYEGFGGARLSRSATIEHAIEVAAFVLEHGSLGVALLNYFQNDLREARDAAMRYLGPYANRADYVREMTEEAITIPDSLRSYIDWNAMARDAEINGDFLSIEAGHGEMHLFAAH